MATEWQWTGKNDKYAVTPEEKASAHIGQSRIWLRMKLLPGEKCRYSYSLDGNEYLELGPECEVSAGTWIGAKTGIFSSSPNVVKGNGFADFDFFSVSE